MLPPFCSYQQVVLIFRQPLVGGLDWWLGLVVWIGGLDWWFGLVVWIWIERLLVEGNWETIPTKPPIQTTNPKHQFKPPIQSTNSITTKNEGS